MFAAATNLAFNPAELSALLMRTQCCTPAVFWRVVREACPRSALLAASPEAKRVSQLAAAGAWTDATLALVKLELPLWTVRRLQLDGGDWHCALSQHRDLPDWLDNAKEAMHRDLAMAILLALIEARMPEVSSPSSSSQDKGDAIVACCENFS